MNAIGGHVKKQYLVSALCTMFALAGLTPASAQTSCTVSNTTGAALQCNGIFYVTGASALADATALLKVVAKDQGGNGVNPGAQNVSVAVCDNASASDKFGISIFRVGSPKDIQRCVTTSGSNASCTETPTPKAANSTSDTLYVVLDVVEEETVGTAATPNAKFRISSTGWEKLQVSSVDTEDSVVLAFSGTGSCS
jgi:hypothetical protein